MMKLARRFAVGDSPDEVMEKFTIENNYATYGNTDDEIG